MQCRGTAAAARLRHSSAVLGKMHDDRPSLNGVRTIMHLAKYETRLAQPVLRRGGDGAAPLHTENFTSMMGAKSLISSKC